MQAADASVRMSFRRVVKNSLFAVSPAVGHECAAVWDFVTSVLDGRFSVTSATRYMVRGLFPVVGGKFTYFGTRTYFPRGSSIFQSACQDDIYERDVTAWLCHLVEPESLFIDVGANIGLTSIPVLREVPTSRVLSFEPSPNSLPYLQRTRRECAFQDRWDVLGKAAGDSEGTVQFCIADPRYGALDGLKDTRRGGELHAVHVPVTTLDTEWRRLGSPRVSCLKIDVEGAEALVLAGAEGIVSHERPYVLLEWHRVNLAAHGIDVGALLSYANSHDYDVVAFPSLVRVAAVHLLEIHMLQTEMFLLVPRQKASTVQHGMRLHAFDVSDRIQG